MRFNCKPQKSYAGRGHHNREQIGCEQMGRMDIRSDFSFGGGRGGHGGGGGKRERIFASGDLKFVVLHLLAQNPGHGYEVIKAMSELVGGDYAPSPGTIYPTLNMLEDLGLITSSQTDGGRKEYRIAPAGETQLAEQRELVERILAHLGQHKNRAQARRLPEIVRAMENLKMALRMRLGDDAPDQLITRRISEIIDRAAVEIERC